MRGKQIFVMIMTVICLFTEIAPVWAQEVVGEQECIDAVGTDYITSEDGLYKYELRLVDGEECVYLESYQGSETNVEIPETIDGYTVKGILLTTLFPNDYPVETVKLPSTIISIAAGAFATTYSLKAILIDTTSRNGFYSEDGILYCRDILVAYPAAKSGETYVVPNYITSIMRGAFYGCSNLKRVVINNFVTNIGRGAFTRCKSEISIVLKKNSLNSTDISNLNNMCCEVAEGTKIVVKTDELREKLLAGMTSTSVYKNSTDTMAVEVAEPVPATSLSFTDGSIEQYVTVSYTDTGYIGDPVNQFSLYSLYQQEPADTTENVTWSLVSADTCPDASNYNGSNPNYYVCQVTSGGTIVTYAGGEAVLKASDESGHELTLHVTVHSPMESCELYGYNNIKTPSIKIESEEDDEWNTVFVKITPFKSYAWNKEVIWESLDPDILEVESTGTRTARVKGLYPGTATLKATVNDDGNLTEKTMEVTVKASVENCTIDAIPTQTYYGDKTGILPQGEALKPEITLRYNGEVMSTEDYEVSYGSQKVGTDNKVWITGKNHLYGTTGTTFEIVVPVPDNGDDSRDEEPVNPPDDKDDDSGEDNTEDTEQPAEDDTKKPGQGENMTQEPEQGDHGKEETPDKPAGEDTKNPEQGDNSKDEPVNTNQPADDATQQPVSQEITGVEASYTKAYGSKSFTLKASGPKPVTYSSSDKKIVTVGSSIGKVTVKGIGKATITITSGTLTKTVTITVIPKTVSSVKTGAKAKSMKVSWKKDKTVTGYQIQYTTDRKFKKSIKTATVKKNKTTSYTLKNLKSKKKYYVRIRAYKTVKGKKYYGNWSKTVSAKVK